MSTTKETNLKNLSTAELDALLDQAFMNQENSLRHGPEYVKNLNAVAAIKQEKASRTDETLDESKKTKDQLDNLPTNLVSGNPLSDRTDAASVVTSPDPDIKALKKEGKKTGTVEGAQTQAAKEPIPGIEPEIAKTTPENQGQ